MRHLWKKMNQKDIGTLYILYGELAGIVILIRYSLWGIIESKLEVDEYVEINNYEDVIIKLKYEEKEKRRKIWFIYSMK